MELNSAWKTIFGTDPTTENKNLLPSSSQPWQWKNHTFVDDLLTYLLEILMFFFKYWFFDIFWTFSIARLTGGLIHLPDWIGMARPRRCRPPSSRPLDTGPSPPLQSATPIPAWAPAPRRPDVAAVAGDGGPAVAAKAPGRPRSSQNLEVETSNGKAPYELIVLHPKAPSLYIFVSWLFGGMKTRVPAW